MKLFIDESLSPQLAIRLNESTRYDAAHPPHIGRRAAPDHRVLQWCIREDRILVTQNARDFRRLAGNLEIHRGLIILPSVSREASWVLLQKALAYFEGHRRPTDIMVNHVLEVDRDGAVRFSALPRA